MNGCREKGNGWSNTKMREMAKILIANIQSAKFVQ